MGLAAFNRARREAAARDQKAKREAPQPTPAETSGEDSAKREAPKTSGRRKRGTATKTTRED